MSEQQTIKYRVIGAAVITVFFGLSWWLLLDHDIQRGDVIGLEIPEPMDIERFDVPKIVPVERKSPEPAKKEDKPKQASEPKPVVKEEKIAKLTDTGLPEAWVVQVGSFQKKENALKLQEKLLGKNYPAYTKRFTVSGKETFRVLIGPKLSKNRAETIKSEVIKSMNLEPRILEYSSGFEQ